jgi:hypothetical protein
VIQLRHGQPSLWHKGLEKDIEGLWEPWMKEVDRLLEDVALLEEVYQAQGKRHRHSPSRGRLQTPAEVALRLLILKQVRNWSYDQLEREVRIWCTERSREWETRRSLMRRRWRGSDK